MIDLNGTKKKKKKTVINLFKDFRYYIIISKIYIQDKNETY